MRLSIEEKQSLVSRYHAGESVAEICADTGVARSTFYTWIKPYSVSAANAEHAVIINAFCKLLLRFVLRAIDFFPLHVRKKRLHNGIVMRLARSGEGLDNLVHA